ncbi:Dabb family protein [Paenibacillus lignilyticus]|uniref:Dabb family protein n=1 Tax=Paenibacillus lignilyticus TaxID=1172615 RepID=A0ABS5C9S7_9BACL|nr:Dabb family protein [Paenibacillus lignilyticus]MBP3962689.1 Dabb family protein [Paenibacillus lignilyticus]
MFEHIVIFKMNATVTPEKEQELVNSLLAFKGAIPGIVELTAGQNITEETGNIHGYSLGLRVTFENRDALRAYGPHPVHQAFVKSLDGLLESVVVVDYHI